MSRGGSFGGGQSSLGYLFGSDNEIPKTPQPVAPKPAPPYGVDYTEKEEADHKKQKISNNNNNNYQRAQGQNSDNFVTTTKVTSVPGGGSSLGYLFGDK
uniref:Protein SPIRAL1-like 5 n=1 Tax=Capsella rubella TaxID=81985 RepID=B2WSA5_9BRAS|nr:unknown [Capsella rubella]